MIKWLILLTFMISMIPSVKAEETPPNIILVVVDDMRTEDWIALPSVKSIFGDNGTTFPYYFTPTPLCCPSRASTLTGLYAHNHGVESNREDAHGGLKAFKQGGNEPNTIAVMLKQAGYRTGLFGKYLNGYQGNSIPQGWDRWTAFSGDVEYLDYDLNVDGNVHHFSGYSTDILANYATDFVIGNAPFFMYYAPKAPHGPSTPAKRHKGFFNGAMLEDDPSINEDDVSDKPNYIRNNNKVNLNDMEDTNRRRLKTLLAVDEDVTQIWNEVIAQGKQDNTYLFFVSDNGYLLGQHRYVHKIVPYDESVRIPMIAYGPAFVAGAIDDRLVANIDLAPTFADLAHLPINSFDGVSLLTNASRYGILLEAFGKDHEVPAYKALRTHEYLYVEYETGEKEYYNYLTDPYELDNHPELAPSDAPALLAHLATCSGPTCRNEGLNAQSGKKKKRPH